MSLPRRASCLLWALPLYLAAAPDATSLLSAVRQAMGGPKWDDVRTLHIQGAVELGGLKGTYESWVDLRHSHTYVDLRFSNPALGAVRDTTGWNGAVSWTADQTGDVCVADSEEARRNATLGAFLDSFAYLRKDGAPAASKARKDATAAGRRFHVVQITPQDAPPFDLWIDAATSRIARTLPIAGADRDVTSYSDFRTVEGLLLPFRIEERGPDSGQFSAITQANSIEINRDPPGRLFDPPAAVLEGLQFPSGSDSVTVPFRFFDGHLYLPVSINGSRLENLVFDTGMTNTIDTGKAKSLGLNIVRAGASYGAGPDAVEQGLAKIARLQIGGLTFENQLIGTTQLPSDPESPLEGGIGYELIKRAVVTIDYSAHLLTFVKPESFRPPADALSLPIRFASSSEVVVEGAVDGIRGEFQFDTGQSMALLLTHPFAERNGLVRKYGSGKRTGGVGIGGEAVMVLFSPSHFSMGPLEPLVSQAGIMLSKTGSGAEEYIAGTIGNDILRQYKVSLDYTRRMVYFEKDPKFNAAKEQIYKMTPPDRRKPERGGWLGFTKLQRRFGDPVEILSVFPDTPAARAGIEPGDWLLAINDSPVGNLTVEELFGPMFAKPGTPVKLTIRRIETTKEVTLAIQ